MVNTKIRIIIFFAAKNGEALYSQQKQDLELSVAQIISILLQNSYSKKKKKSRKTTRTFRYKIPYNYAVELIYRIKGIGLVYRMPEELWTEVCNTV